MFETTFSSLFDSVAKQNPEAPCVQDAAGNRATRAEHFGRVRRLVGGFHTRLGLDKSSKFAVLANNSIDYVTLWHVAAMGGGVVVPINNRLTPRDMAQMVTDSGSQVLFADNAHGELAGVLLEQCDTLRQIVSIDGEGDGSLQDLQASEEKSVDAAGNDPFLLIYTGGTTGRPKGVLHTQGSIIHSILIQLQMYRIEPGRSMFCLSAPLYHIAGVAAALTAPVAGATIVVAASADPNTFIRLIDQYKISHAWLVVTLLGRVLQSPEFDPARLASLRQVSYGGAAITEALLTDVAVALPEVELLNAYGMTEAGLLTALTGDDHRRMGNHLKSVGRPMVGVDLDVRDEQGDVLARGEAGEITARTASLMSGYLNMPEATEAVCRDGRYHTGDIGYFDQEGYLYVVDRKNDMIISGGENIYSLEVENAVASHPAVDQVAVIGVSDADWGEAVHAVVCLKPGASASSRAIIAHCRELLASYKCPKVVHIQAEALPISGTNKVLKSVLREQYGH